MLSPTHIVLLGIVLLLALVVFGPKRLPELGSSVGRAIQEFKHASSSVREDLSTAGTELRQATNQTHVETPLSPVLPQSNTVVQRETVTENGR